MPKKGGSMTDAQRAAMIASNRARATHGHKANSMTSAEYSAWCSMYQRCNDPGYRGYERYGGRGIKICDRWRKFENFLADMGPRPPSAHSIDRINNDGNYEPGNCRWATARDQARNRRNNVIVTFRGREMCMAEAIELSGLNKATVWDRIRCGWEAERALTTPARMYVKEKTS